LGKGRKRRGNGKSNYDAMDPNRIAHGGILYTKKKTNKFMIKKRKENPSQGRKERRQMGHSWGIGVNSVCHKKPSVATGGQGRSLESRRTCMKRKDSEEFQEWEGKRAKKTVLPNPLGAWKKKEKRSNTVGGGEKRGRGIGKGLGVILKGRREQHAQKTNERGYQRYSSPGQLNRPQQNRTGVKKEKEKQLLH